MYKAIIINRCPIWIPRIVSTIWNRRIHKAIKFEKNKTKMSQVKLLETAYINLQIDQEILSKAIKIALYVLYCTASVLLFSNFSCMFLNPKNFSNLNLNCSNLSCLRNLQEQVKKTFCYQKLFGPFTVWVNLVIAKIFQTLGLLPRISKVFLNHWNIFSHCRSEQVW